MAVLRGEAVLADLAGDPALTHGQRLPADLMRALAVAGASLDGVDLLAVLAGPGSFTGLRVGIATMQGLAFARRLRIVPVSTLDALARAAAREHPGAPYVAPWIDAQRQEVYAALHAVAQDRVVIAPSAARPEDTLRAWRDRIGDDEIAFAGDGAARYRALIEASLGTRARFVDLPASLAVAAGRIAASEPHRAVLPHAVVPLYVRKPDAEIARDRRTSS